MLLYTDDHLYAPDVYKLELAEEDLDVWKNWLKTHATVMYPEDVNGRRNVKFVREEWTSFAGGKMKETTVVRGSIVPYEAGGVPPCIDLDYPEHTLEYTKGFIVAVSTFTYKKLYLTEITSHFNMPKQIFFRFMCQMKQFLSDRKNGIFGPTPEGNLSCPCFYAIMF